MHLKPSALLFAVGLAGCVTPTPGLVVPGRFTALGTEPFWAARVEGTRLTYSTPDDGQGRTIAVIRRDARESVVVEGLLDGSTLQIEVTTGPCSDGMSDIVYPFAVRRRIGDALAQGCARPG